MAGKQSTTSISSPSTVAEAFESTLDAVVADEEFSEYSAEAPALRQQVKSQARDAIVEGVSRAGQHANRQLDTYAAETAFLSRSLVWSTWIFVVCGVLLIGVGLFAVQVLNGSFPPPGNQPWTVVAVVMTIVAATTVALVRLRRVQSALRSVERSRSDAQRIEELALRDMLRSTVSGAYSSAISNSRAEDDHPEFPRKAPRLIELEVDSIVPLASIDQVTQFIEDHATSAIGITGPRGAGKSTLLSAVCDKVRDLGGEAVLIPSPVEHDAMDLLRSIAVELRGDRVSTAHSEAVRLEVRQTFRRRGVQFAAVILLMYLAIGLIAIGVLPGAGSRVIAFVATFWPAIAGVLLACVAGLLLFRYRPLRRRLTEAQRTSDDILDGLIESLTYEVADGRAVSAGVSGGPFEMSGERSHNRTARDVSHSQLSSALRDALRSRGDGSPGPFLLAIDELDKLPNREALLNTVNAIKDLLHLRNVHVAMTLSDEALGAFELRQTTERDAFDSTFDTIIDVDRLDESSAIAIIDSRAAGFPRPLTLALFVWAGGLPRDLLRHARSCVDYVKGVGSPPAWQDIGFAVAEAEAIRKMSAAVRAGSSAAAIPTVRNLASTWTRRPPAAQDLDAAADLDETCARLCAYSSLCFAANWVVLLAEQDARGTGAALTVLRDGVVATALEGSLATATNVLAELTENGYLSISESPPTDDDGPSGGRGEHRQPLDSSVWWG